jgi:signal peptidase I
MEPALFPGDRLWVDRHAYRHRSPGVGEIVVVIDPELRSRWLVKRVGAVGPGRFGTGGGGPLPRMPEPTHAEGTTPPTAGETVTLPPGSIWVVGDAADASRDSRRFGPVTRNGIVGKVVRCYAPPAHRRDL